MIGRGGQQRQELLQVPEQLSARLDGLRRGLTGLVLGASGQAGEARGAQVQGDAFDFMGDFGQPRQVIGLQSQFKLLGHPRQGLTGHA